MSYKLKKKDLLDIANYVISENNKISDEQLISSFYEKLMYALDTNKNTYSNNFDNNDYLDNEKYIEINSDDEESYKFNNISKLKKKTIKKNKS